MGTEQGVSRFYAVAGNHRAGTYTLVVLRRVDDHEVWGDEPLPAHQWADIPTAATARLARSGHQPVGDWHETPAPTTGPIHGPSWQADVHMR